MKLSFAPIYILTHVALGWPRATIGHFICLQR